MAHYDIIIGEVRMKIHSFILICQISKAQPKMIIYGHPSKNLS